MNSKKLVFYGFVCLIPAGVFANTSLPYAVDVATKKVEAFCDIKAPEAQLITSNEMKLLNDVLALFPITTVRMKLAEQQTHAVQKKLQDRLNIQMRNAHDDQKFIQEQLKAVIEPIKQFFDLIRSYKDVAQPLIKQCLQNQEYRKNSSPEDSLLYQFFEKTGPVDTLASQEIKTIESLMLLCKDVEALSGSIIKSLSDRSKAAFEKTMQVLHNKKKQPAKSA